MQTTLLSLGIAIIIALVAALVGPLFIDWGQYRATIEAEASKVVGIPVRVAGSIDVRLLPTPSLKLADVELRPAGSAQKLTARGLAMEFGLGTLMRGEFRANQITIDRPELTVALDRSGAVQVPAPNFGFDPDRLAIERLTVDDGRLTLVDATSGARLAFDQFSLTGDVSSLIGPFKAEGSFMADGERFAYRLSGSRRGDDGGMKLRLAVDPVERALALETDGTLWVENGAPRYEGAVTLSRIVGTTQPDGRVTINDPWKLTGRLKATAKSALVEQLDLQYGPESASGSPDRLGHHELRPQRPHRQHARGPADSISTACCPVPNRNACPSRRSGFWSTVSRRRRRCRCRSASASASTTSRPAVPP